MSLCGIIPVYSVCVPWLDGRAGSEVNTGCIFPQSVLAATTLMGGRAGVGRARARARYKPGFFLCSVDIIALSQGRTQGAGAGALRELGFSQVLRQFLLWFGMCCGFRAWSCISVLRSLFPQYVHLGQRLAGSRGVGATSLSRPCLLLSVHSDA